MSNRRDAAMGSGAAEGARAWMRTVGFLLRKEFRQVRRDRVMLFQIFAIPLIQLLVLANAATFEIRDTRMHVVDASRSVASRDLVRGFAASKYFSVESTSAGMRPADERLLAGDVSLVLRIPTGFDRELARGEPAAVQLVLSATDGASAGIVGGYGRAIVAAYGARVAGSSGRPADRYVEVESRGWYNETLDYQQHMVPGILVVLVTIIGTLLASMNIVREKEIGTLEQLNATPLRRSEFIAGKLLPFWIIALLELGFGLVVARIVFDIPMRGSLVLLFGAGGIYLVVALGVGLWISTMAETQQQAMFVTYFFLMINLFMSGLFTPTTSMPAWGRIAAEFIPLKHFIDIARSVLVKGAGPEALVVPLVALAVMGLVVFTVSVRQYSKTVG
ncbi:MAG: ABC transporter permease [Gemmatimonadota bacterium]